VVAARSHRRCERHHLPATHRALKSAIACSRLFIELAVCSLIPNLPHMELEKAATIKGFYGELAEVARPYGGIEGYVQHQFEKANPSTPPS
jgi:hypothetical protein